MQRIIVSLTAFSSVVYFYICQRTALPAEKLDFLFPAAVALFYRLYIKQKSFLLADIFFASVILMIFVLYV
jgi:hypothetical protein